MRKFFLIALTALLISGCNNNPPKEKEYEKNPQYTWGYAFFFGDYYEDVGIENNVVSMSLFTEDLFIRNDSLIGTGQYLYIEELFLAPTDTLLPVGVYTVSDSREPMTILPGQIAEEYPMTMGACITYIEKSETALRHIIGGTFTVHSSDEKQCHITFDLITNDGENLYGECKREIKYYNALRKDAEQSKRKNKLKFRLDDLKEL